MKAGSPPAAAVVLRYNFPTLQTVLLHACMKAHGLHGHLRDTFIQVLLSVRQPW